MTVNSGPYRTDERAAVRAQLLEAVESARAQQARVVKVIDDRNDSKVFLDQNDLAAIKELRATFAEACKHERLLLKQLAGLEGK